jgi:uncharacterized small protein (DUF1192 family)
MKTEKVIMEERIVVKLESFKSMQEDVQALRKEIEQLKAES